MREIVIYWLGNMLNKRGKKMSKKKNVVNTLSSERTESAYLNFINSINGTRIVDPLNIPKLKRSYWIRHDVDISLPHALYFAEFEAKNGIISTYFLLHNNEYFDYSENFANIVKRLISLGHTIAFHNDVLSLWWEDKTKDIISLLNPPLNFLRQFSTVEGTACHGHACHYERGYINYEVWKEYDPTKNYGFEIKCPKISLNDVGLKYEAYFLPYTHLYSDSGKNDIGYVVGNSRMFEKDALLSKRNIGLKVIDEFNKEDSGFLELLFHPIYWGRK